MIKCQIRKHDGELKITWGDDVLEFEAYTVSEAVVRTFGLAVRHSLADLVHATTKQNVVDAEVAKAIHNIAVNGNKLWEALFVSEKATKPKQWISRKIQNPTNVIFHVGDRIHLPLGLMFPFNVPVKPSTDKALYNSFLCLKHQVTTVHFRTQPRDTPDQPQTPKKLSVIHDAVHKNATDALKTKDLAEANQIDQELNNGILAKTTHDFEVLLDRHRGELRLVSFYCHADGTTLVLGATEHITAENLALKLFQAGAVNTGGSCLFVLNGCCTAIGGNDYGFFNVLNGSAFAGFIGAETKVPDVFALRFGHQLVLGIVKSNKPIEELFQTLQHRHWPLSLIYQLYCEPKFKWNPIDDPVDWHVDEKNFSEGLLGTVRL